MRNKTLPLNTLLTGGVILGMLVISPIFVFAEDGTTTTPTGSATPSVSETETMSETPSTTVPEFGKLDQNKSLSIVKQNIVNELNRRIKNLEERLTDLNNSNENNPEKATMIANINTQITTLQGMIVQVQGATTLQQLATIISSAKTEYKSFHASNEQAALLGATQKLENIITTLTGVEPKLTDLLTQLNLSTKDGATLTDMEKNITAAKTATDAALAVLNTAGSGTLTPAQVQQVQTDLKTARQDLENTRNDLHQIIRDLHQAITQEFHLQTTPTPSVTVTQ